MDLRIDHVLGKRPTAEPSAEIVDGIAARFASVPADIFMPNKWRGK